MKQKHTPESVLDILKEVKHLLDSGNYNSNYLVKKYPSFSGFRRVLIQKGIINSNRYGVKVWGSSVLPNIIMAREILKIHYNYCKDKNEVYKDRIKPLKPLNNTKTPKKTAMSLAKEIREDGESWNDSVSRASKIMREEKQKSNYLKGGALPMQTFSEVFENKEIKKSVGKPLREIPPADLEEMIEAKNEEIKELHDAYEKLRKVKQPFFENNHYRTLYIAEEVQNKNHKQQLENITKDRDLLYSNVRLHIDQNKQIVSDFAKKITEKEDIISENNDEILALKKSFDENSNEYIEQLQNSIKERESQIMEADNEIKRLQNEVGILKPQQSKFRDLTYDEIWCNSKQLTSKSSRTFKLFGIPIFSIDNK
jgi:hypothetical protein